MASASINQRRATAFRSIALTASLVATGPLAHANDYSEGVSGDASNNPASPTNVSSLTSGANKISGASVPSGTFDPGTHSYSMVDDDYLSFTVPAGFALSAIVLGSDSSIGPSDRFFMAIAHGSAVSVDPSFSSAAGLLGWTLVGASMVGSDLLASLGASAPTNFPPIGGAAGFTGSLPSGDYTLWIRDADGPVTYDLTLEAVAAVPEPADWAMVLAGLSLTGATLRRRERLR